MPEFKTTIRATGNNTGIIVPESVLDQLDAGKRPAVKVTVDGYAYRSTVGKMSGTFMIPLSAEHREISGLAGGDEVTVKLEVDAEPRTVEVPEDLAAALKESGTATQAYDELSPSKKKWLVKSIVDAKKPETRARRIAKSIEDLESGKA
jgi:hypothetical protein